MEFHMPRAKNIARKNTENKAAKSKPEELRERISKAAYFLSEQRGCNGNDIQNWLDAEISISHK
jgi:Protein of unknown function (DUF2934)